MVDDTDLLGHHEDQRQGEDVKAVSADGMDEYVHSGLYFANTDAHPDSTITQNLDEFTRIFRSNKTEANTCQTDSTQMEAIRRHCLATDTEDLIPPWEPEQISISQQQTDFSWNALHQNFLQDMARERDTERSLCEELDSLIKFYGVWVQVPFRHEERRAAKRLQTRAAFLRTVEQDLSDKHMQYAQVRKAFTHAIGLLDQK